MRKFDELTQNGQKWYFEFEKIFTHRTSLKLSHLVESEYEYGKSEWEWDVVVGSSGVRKFKKYIENGFQKIYAYCKGTSHKFANRIDYYIFIK